MDGRKIATVSTTLSILIWEVDAEDEPQEIEVSQHEDQGFFEVSQVGGEGRYTKWTPKWASMPPRWVGGWAPQPPPPGSKETSDEDLVHCLAWMADCRHLVSGGGARQPPEFWEEDPPFHRHDVCVFQASVSMRISSFSPRVCFR